MSNDITITIPISNSIGDMRIGDPSETAAPPPTDEEYGINISNDAEDPVPPHESTATQQAESNSAPPPDYERTEIDITNDEIDGPQPPEE